MMNTLKLRLIAIGLMIGFLICYLEWGGGNSGFILKMEIDLLFKKADKSNAFMHPLVILPFAGQFLLLVAMFQKRPNRQLVLWGMILLSLLVLMILLIGLLGGNLLIIGSTLVFLAASVYFMATYKRYKLTNRHS